MYIYSYRIEFGNYSIVEEDGAIIYIFEKDTREDLKNLGMEERETDLIKRTYIELEEYLKGDRKEFSVPIRLKGTDFQKAVWKELLNIPYGETRSYKEVAKNIGREKAYRAVGNANNKNPIIIIVPCHRVVGADGSLVGYRKGLDMKKKLLELEK